MYRRFERIHGCGIFEDFRWENQTPEFQRINLIYGSNGSGKTSLASALDDARHDETGYTKLSVKIEDTGSHAVYVTSETDDESFDRTFVFSKGYVSRNQHLDNGSTTSAILTLGEKTIDQQKRIEELLPLIQEAEALHSDAKAAVGTSEKTLETAYRNLARSVVTSLYRAQGQYSSNGRYNQRTARERFAASHDSWKILSEAEKKKLLATVNSDKRNLIQPRQFSFKVRAELPSEILSSLSATPITVLLDTLTDHPEATSWVDQGRHLHDGIETCIFCGGTLTESRRHQIDEHFSDAVNTLQTRIDSLFAEVEDNLGSVSLIMKDDSLSSLLYDDLRERFVKAQIAVEKQVADCHALLISMRNALRTKRENVLLPITLKASPSPAVQGDVLEDIIRSHNNRVSEHESDVQTAAQTLELHFLKEAEPEIQTCSTTLAEKRSTETDLATRLKTYRDELTGIQTIEGDPLPSAKDMTTELTRILGRSELVFETTQDGKQYQVERHGSPARDLSTGERTAIALIHFLETVKHADPGIGKPIVVIDDPISSLDREAAMGISTYIWSETVSKDYTEQVFLLTHSFELFREWDIQIDGLPGRERKRGEKNTDGFTSSTYELVSRYQDISGTFQRVPVLITWPPNGRSQVRKKIRSSYHHAFIQVATALQALRTEPTMEKQLDALLLYPNVLRRMLETFLAFKDPESVPDFTGSMRKMGSDLTKYGYQGDADALRLQLTRFSHAYSHSDTPETNVALPPEEILPTIQAVFEFMNALDSAHFQGLCTVTGLDSGDLLTVNPDTK